MTRLPCKEKELSRYAAFRDERVIPIPGVVGVCRVIAQHIVTAVWNMKFLPGMFNDITADCGDPFDQQFSIMFKNYDISDLQFSIESDAENVTSLLQRRFHGCRWDISDQEDKLQQEKN